MITIAIDAMGGDDAPDFNIDGAFESLRADDGLCLVLVGPEKMLREKISSRDRELAKRIEVCDAPSVITPNEHPVQAIRKKKDSSLVTGLGLVKSKKASAFISAGSSGAILAGGQLLLGRIPGVLRTPLATMIPTLKGFSLFMDLGANVDARPEWLCQYARMGTIYMDKVMHKPNASVKLVNLGMEEEKGNALIKAAHPLISSSPDINYQGFVESRDILNGEADIYITDAFTGNAIIKTFEGTSRVLISLLKEVLMSGTKTKLAAAVIMKPLKERLKQFDASSCGGAILLGLDGVVIKCHGNSKSADITAAVMKAAEYARQDVNTLIRSAFAENI